MEVHIISHGNYRQRTMIPGSKAGRQWDAAPPPPPTHRPTSPKNREKDGKLRRATCRSQPDLEHSASSFLDFTPKRGNPGEPLPHCPHLGKPQTLCTSLGASRRSGDNGALRNEAESAFISPNEAPESDGGDPEGRGASGPRSQVPGRPRFPSARLEARKERGLALPGERVKGGRLTRVHPAGGSSAEPRREEELRVHGPAGRGCAGTPPLPRTATESGRGGSAASAPCPHAGNEGTPVTPPPPRSVGNKKNSPPKPREKPRAKPKKGAGAAQAGVGARGRRARAALTAVMKPRGRRRTQYGSGGMCQGAAAPCAAAAAPPSRSPWQPRASTAPRRRAASFPAAFPRSRPSPPPAPPLAAPPPPRARGGRAGWERLLGSASRPERPRRLGKVPLSPQKYRTF
ncbi:nascent polypeptide-associated complex subunit alpha, muscle-specific form-like [Pyrgilauda ruficollis]|uniref:nascent polypeptide-associated complex subunit alpha, muscle-specific form-like n=1 Tax=Pyrgilauda ruficollis TaxID=221976 RepID=UPI001B860E20|nr:nascent polypeptide-associated complex subunit alpha, muscle-specific form-like [Pyrgilauda ruficollis]